MWQRLSQPAKKQIWDGNGLKLYLLLTFVIIFIDNILKAFIVYRIRFKFFSLIQVEYL